MIELNNSRQKGVKGEQHVNGSKVALVYCRVSTQKQEEEGTSLESQAAACIAHAEKLGYRVGRVTKEAYSAAELFERPLLSRDRSDIRAGMFQAIIVYAVDRLSRDIAHLAILSDEFERARCSLIFVTEELDNTPEGKLMQSVRGYVAEVERQKIRERCVRGKRQKALNGRVVRGGTDLFGYSYNKEQGVRIVNEAEAQVVRQIFQWAAEGVSTHSIVRRLNEQDTPPPSKGKRIFKDGRKAYWGTGTVKRILNEPAYKGEAYAWRWKSAGRRNAVIVRPADEWIKLPPETTPAVVANELWEVAQHKLRANRGDEKRNEQRPDLLRGHVFCAVCGRRMRGDNEHGRYRVYRCPSRLTPQGACGSKRIPAEDCESLAWEQVKNILNDPSIISAEIERRHVEGEDSRSQVLADLESTRRELCRIETELARLVSRAASAPEDVWQLFEKEIAGKQEVKKRLEVMAADIEARLAAEEADAEGLAALSNYADRVRKRLAVFTFAEKRLALDALAVKIYGNGRDWRLDGGLPDVSVPFTTYCSLAHRVQARRCLPNACRPSCRRSNLKPRLS
jgi:site-specific DNA recombinase